MTSHCLSPGGGGGWRILVAWFSGGTKGRLVVADRVQRKDYRKLTASEEGGGGGSLEYDIA